MGQDRVGPSQSLRDFLRDFLILVRENLREILNLVRENLREILHEKMYNGS